MQNVEFKDFIKLQRGFDLPEHLRVKGSVPVVASTSITSFHNVAKVTAPGVVTGRSGALGEVQYIDRDFWPLNTTLWVKDFKGNEPKYVYYFLKTLDLKRFNSGAGVPTLNRNDLDTLKIKIHNSDTQKTIAKVLSNYDDSIENNNKRIKILEEMAQKIYKEWFVDFKFPGHESSTFKDSELGKIPKNWKLECIGNLISNIESGSRPKGGINPNEKDIPSIGAENILGLGKYDYTKEKYVSSAFFVKMKKGKVQNLDVLLYKDGAQLGRKTLFGGNFPHEKCCINEHVFILRTNEHISPFYLYFTLDTIENTERIKQLNTNAAQPGINQEQVKGLKIIQPKKDLIDSFDKIIQPFVSQIFKLCIKNKNLKQTRDILLPRLISGEIDVENMEIK